MRKSLIFTAALAAAMLLSGGCGALAIPEGLLFYASFDHLTTNADFAAGDPKCTLDAKLDFRSAEGIIGNGLMQEPGERCSYQVPGNLDTSRGSFSIWVKPLSWDGHSGKFRHFVVITGVENYRMLLYLYPIGDEAVINYIQVNPKTPEEAIWRAGAPVDILQKDQWTHLVSTWDGQAVRLYANGRRVGEGLVASPLPKADTGVFTICPIEFWKHPQWSDPDEKTICDEVRVFDHALSDDEVLDLYASELPGGLPDLKPALAVGMKPDYFASSISVTVCPAHLDDAWRARIEAGAELALTVTDPQGRELLSRTGPPQDEPFAVEVPEWVDGDYLARASLSAGGERLEGEATLTKPPTPWLPRVTDWRATRVLEPWTPLQRDGG
ncbi:MAG TPA: LamG domain-containing protein, partial [Armatimonadota bacterium]|nr:LamG domain-containing protein [Armatimonadota bacterium]